MWELVLLYLKLLSDWFRTIIGTCILFIPVSAVLYFLLRFWIKSRSRSLRPELRQPSADCQRPIVVGFFHPYCNAGGGGERVLWIAIRALQKRYKFVRCVVYSGDQDVTGDEILQRVWQRFNIKLQKPVEFVFLSRRNWVEASRYPYFTMLGQSFGSIVLGWEALMKFVPDIYIDSMGYAFTIPLFKYLGDSKVCCYVHYPTISTDMLKKVSERGESHNNRSFISRSPMVSSVKVIYYRLFAYLYGIVGSRCDAVLVNSSWTLGHIAALWNVADCTNVVYPPCDTDEFLRIPLERNDGGEKRIASVAQFRPEKDHPLQIHSFHQFLQSKNASQRKQYKLVLIGGCRNAEDAQRVAQLKALCDELGISDFVEFKTNISFKDLKMEMGRSIIGLHTMWNEHFGIGVVEMMAAGCIALAHNSGGPKMDIVIKHNGQPTGFLADDVSSYRGAMNTILNLTQDELLCLQLNARDSVYRFSESKFEEGFLSATEKLFHPTN